MEPPLVISVKQEQSSVVTFEQGKSAAITWCDQLKQPVHVQLRSIKSPMFALDAMHAAKFEWNADSIARWQPGLAKHRSARRSAGHGSEAICMTWLCSSDTD